MWTVGRGCYVVASDGRAEIQGSKVPKLHGMEWPTNDALSATNKIRSVSRSKGQLESSIRQKAHLAANVRGKCEKGKYPTLSSSTTRTPTTSRPAHTPPTARSSTSKQQFDCTSCNACPQLWFFSPLPRDNSPLDVHPCPLPFSLMHKP